ncbi:cytochrome c-type biogenesis protein CcsB [Austwickia chelonae]|uniref:Putative cytochrome c assembly protein n=1 Tax=Austwickia chelonae NBRC 105200 TaxID=1184607 RepID=K6UL30_9MICO|nr:c-type cytochrome biogenesis protein CcsB [Austwickia chelonae]GAB76891.1 putative cytochrome c assembly protein [Austwickia chelonae NBRC 105200]SEW32036.1 cytochrome c-type biogenesis protein CcsB [Austwickia chelonae]
MTILLLDAGIDLQLANYANLALYAAMVVLTLAMLAFAVYVAFADRPDAAGRPATQDREKEFAGVGGTSVGAGTGESSAEVVEETAGSPLGEERQGAPQNRPSRPRGASAGVTGASLTWLSLMFLVVSVVCRGLASNRVPVANMFEFAVFGSMLVLAVYLGMGLRWPLTWLGLFVTTPVLLVLGLALTVWYSPAAELLPSLRSLWLAIHVPIATLSVAVFTIAASVLVLHLVKERRERKVVEGRASRASFLDTLPRAESLDRTAYSLHIVAFPLWTFSLIAGAIWAQQAWGYYWNWDPKETWTFIIWVIYAGYLHARSTSGWSRRTANALAIVGYLAIIVNFAVVNIYFAGQHSYSGL